MAATDPHSMLVDEIRRQVNAALTVNADKLQRAEWPGLPRAHFTHDVTVIRWGDAAPEFYTNEHDRVEYGVLVGLTTKGADREAMGQTLSLWARTVRRTLADRPSDRSPLATNPLPLSSLNLANAGAAFLSVRFGATETMVDEVGAKAFRGGVIVPVIVTLQEVASG